MSQKEYAIQLPVINYFQSFFKDMFLSVSFFITLATAISKSSWVTCTRRSRKANMPASVHTAYTSPTHIKPQNSQASCNPSIGLQQGNERFENRILSFPVAGVQVHHLHFKQFDTVQLLYKSTLVVLNTSFLRRTLFPKQNDQSSFASNWILFGFIQWHSVW